MGNSLNNQYSTKQISKFYQQKQKLAHQTCQIQFQSYKPKSNQQIKLVVQQLDELYFLQKILEARKNSKFLISVENFIIQQEFNFFKNFYKVTFVNEKTPICITDLHQISFKDVLHMTYQILQGFYQLSKLIGYFHINANMIRINQDRIVKVWITQDVQKFFFTKRATQTVMVKQILNLIQQMININEMPRDNPSLINYMYRNYQRISFKMGVDQILKFAARYDYSIPYRLECFDNQIQKRFHNQIYSEVLFSTDTIQRESQLKQYLKLEQSERTIFNNSESQKNDWKGQNNLKGQNNDWKGQNNLKGQKNEWRNQKQNKELKIRIHTFNRQSSDETEQSQQKVELINYCIVEQKLNENRKTNKISLKCIKK